jgi:hypothetical protein
MLRNKNEIKISKNLLTLFYFIFFRNFFEINDEAIFQHWEYISFYFILIKIA